MGQERYRSIHLAGLAEAKLAPSPDADRVTLVRRLAFDLTGLPPSQADLDKFALASQPAPLEQLVDQYLESDQYGERMGRRWLDVARYAESTGKDVNVAYPTHGAIAIMLSMRSTKTCLTTASSKSRSLAT